MPGERVIASETRNGKQVLKMQSGREIVVDGVVAGIGVEPDLELAERAGVKTDHGILVDEYLRTNQLDIYAAGDVASFPMLGSHRRVEHEDNANSMGERAGRNMAGDERPYDHLPSFYSDMFDLAHDTNGTIEEGRRLWHALSRPNVFIKVPASAEGVPAIRQLISEGINVNVTLLFGLPRYREVVEAYVAGLEARVAKGQPIDTIASVASFFLSRIDTLVDPMLEALIAKGSVEAKVAHGQIAIASARIAYRMYKDVFHCARFQKFVAQGARSQRLLWASTSTKNPDYGDLKYVEPLIGPDTINTVTTATLDAYRDHGEPAIRIEEDMPLADRVMKQLSALAIDIDRATRQLDPTRKAIEWPEGRENS